MGLWPSRAVRTTARVREDMQVRQTAPADPIAAAIAAATADRLERVSLHEALTVPAFVRALQLYRGVIGSFPLQEFPNGSPGAPIPNAFLEQPDPDATTGYVLATTAEHLLAYGAAYWWVTDSRWDGFPAAARVLPADQVLEVPGRDPQFDPPIGVTYGGRAFPYALGRSAKSSAGHVIRFKFGHGVLATGGATLRAAIALEDATRRYADSPVPQATLHNTGADLPEDQVLEMLDAWEESRRTRATAYLSAAVTLETAGFNPEQLQMVDARNMAAVQVARLFNLDPVWIGAGVPGSSITYANRVDLYRQLVDLSLAPVMAAISQRLTMRDVTARGHQVRFDTSTFLRDDPAAVSEFLSRVMPLGLATTDEGRDLLGLPPYPGGPLPPSQEAESA